MAVLVTLSPSSQAEDAGEDAMMAVDIKEEVCEEEDGRKLDGNLGEEETLVQNPVMVQRCTFSPGKPGMRWACCPPFDLFCNTTL